LLGTDTWIGATECAALLRFFGIKAQVVDFGLDLGSFQECAHPTMRLQTRPADAVCDQCDMSIYKIGGRSYCCKPCEYDLCPPCFADRKSKSEDFLKPTSKEFDGYESDEVSVSISRQQSKQSKASVSLSHVSLRLKAWLNAYFALKWPKDATYDDNFCPPLYFQHDGHSRTIVGT
jgi:Peptidase family C78